MQIFRSLQNIQIHIQNISDMCLEQDRNRLRALRQCTVYWCSLELKSSSLFIAIIKLNNIY